MHLRYVPIRMTDAMFEESKKFADECRIPHAEWIRRCICWGTVNPEFIRDNKCLDEYKVPPRGRPNEEY